MSERTFRSLTLLTGASTSRVLNLNAIRDQKLQGDVAPSAAFFSSPAMNTSIIMKHRMRSDDLDLMPSRKPVCTKIIVPLDKRDLRAGGKSLFVGQQNYTETLRDVGQYLAKHDMERDMRVLQLLDALPSLDPFLLREKLRSDGISPDSRYFSISPADQRRMFDYATGELNRLTDLAGGNESATARMVAALLSTDVDEKLEPLRETLRLSQNEFKEGVFSWRGFIYYKWCRAELWPPLVNCLRHLKSLQPAGPVSNDQKSALGAARESILVGAKQNSDGVKRLLQIYEDAYNSLLRGRDPRQFRKFLLDAPALFLDIGEKMGALSHITSFWRFRFPDPERANIDAEELVMMLQDFSKGFVDREVKVRRRSPAREALDQLLASDRTEPYILLPQGSGTEQEGFLLSDAWVL
jgi:hypothetical protein